MGAGKSTIDNAAGDPNAGTTDCAGADVRYCAIQVTGPLRFDREP